MQAHHHVPVGTKDEKRLRLDVHAGHQMQFKTLQDGCHDERGFHEAEVVADALPRAGAEWGICTFVALLYVLRCESFGVEGIGSIPDVWMTMYCVHSQCDCRVCMEIYSSDLH